MKKILISILFGLFCATVSYAFAPVWKASHTVTADTTQNLCAGKTYILNTSTVSYGNTGIVHGVCVNDAGAGSGTFTLYDSSASANNAFAVIRATSAINMGCLYYDVQTSSGITYTNSATNDVTILYMCE